ncbi:hypothetical protein TFLX_05361 [Thermoflexales bacterium]|nr:hypothetical protein TFLX_05361 [Thermoflexales bacterium]
MHTRWEHRAVSVGDKVWRLCVQGSQTSVLGVTSRGLFLLALPQHIVFVSFERYRSPLTINLDQAFERLGIVEVGATAQFSDSRLIFPSIEDAISLSAVAVWHCPPPSLPAQPRAEQTQLLQMIAKDVLAQAGSNGLVALLPRLMDWPDASSLTTEHFALLDQLLAVRRAVQVGDHPAMIAGLTSLLGQGRGLTPSGDDVVIGLLLLLNRWPADRDWMAVNRAVIEAAYQVTTTLSANLIECAAAGQGDERLITVADGIAAGSTSIEECVDCVLKWGSSSGSDALIGMALAVQAAR